MEWLKFLIYNKKSLLYITIFVSAFVTLGGTYFYFWKLDKVYQDKFYELESVTSLKTEQILQWKKQVEKDALRYAENKRYNQLASDYLNNKNSNTNELLHSFHDLNPSFEYQNIGIYSPSRNKFIALDSTSFLLHEEVDYSGAGITFNDFYISENNIYYDLVIRLEKSGTDAVLILRINPDNYLFNYIQSVTTGSKTLESLFFRREGKYVLFFNKPRNSKSFQHIQLPLSNTNLPSSMAVNGILGKIEGSDYRGQNVLAFAKTIPDTDWFFISKIDKNELIGVVIIEVLSLSSIIFLSYMIIVFAYHLASKIKQNDQLKKENNLLIEKAEIESELYESKRELHTLLSNLQGMVYKCMNDESWTIIYVSEGCFELTGYQVYELQSNHVIAYSDIILEEDRKYVNDLIQDAISFNTTYELEYRIKDKFGNNKWVWEKGQATFDADKLLHLEGLIIDITQRKNLETKLYQSEQIFRTIFENSSIGNCITDGEKIFRVNKAFCEMIGYDEEELIEKNMMDLTHPDDVKKSRDILDSMLKGEFNKINYEKRYFHKNGNLIWADVNNALQYESKGIYFFILSVNNVTDKKIVEEELQVELINKIISENRIKQLNKVLEAIRGINKLITVEKDKKTLITKACKLLVDSKRVFKAAISLVNPDLAVIVKSEQFNVIEKVDYNYSLPCHENFKDIKSMTVVQKSVYCAECSVGCYQNEGSVLVTSLIYNELKFGIISITLEKNSDSGDEQERIILSELAADIAFALSKIDLEQQKEIAEIQLKESENRYRSLFENAVMGFYQCAMNGEILIANQAMIKMLGFTDFNELKRGYQLNPVSLKIRKGGDVIIDLETVWLKKNGEQIYVSENGKIISDENGKPHYYEGTVEDITLRKSAEEKIREQAMQYENLANTGVALVWTADYEKKCNYFNKPWLNFTGRTLEQELELGWTEGVHKEDMQQCLEIYCEAFDKKSQFDMEYRLRHNSGEYRWIRDYSAPIYDHNGNFAGYIGHCFDITEEKSANDALLEAKEKAEQMNKLKSIFFANMSHELRTPLIGILGYTELMLSELDEPEHLEMIEVVHKSGKRLLETLNQILNLSKIEAEQHELSAVPVKISEVLKNCYTLFNKSLNDKKIQFYYIDNTFGLEIMADERALENILINLINNAIKFTESGSITIVSELLIQENKSLIRFSVSDTGIGISNESQSIIFKEFRQASEGYTRNFEGSGLGLTISRKLVNLLGGEIYVESELGKGSKFYFDIPLSKVTLSPNASESDYQYQQIDSNSDSY